ncbi:hypothetical protein HDU87_000361 [Geranomyces variabilis]|uniref:Uncharacterized protein n=1 Tax=Geranomyces variabilis TaxID=109894 RepID=A0AAD5TNV0_9FUNG|nr:hypothetical protein HDU87_000361 [Geranomyces variabilis]
MAAPPPASLPPSAPPPLPLPLRPLHALSDRLVSFSPRTLRFGLAILLYTLSLVLLGFLERRALVLAPEAKLPSARKTYSSQDLNAFYDAIGPAGRRWYAAYLVLEIPSLAVWTLFAALIISAFTTRLVFAENELEEALKGGKAKKETKREDGAHRAAAVGAATTAAGAGPPPAVQEPLPLAPRPSLPPPETRLLHATLLNTVPVIFAALQVIETFLLLSALSVHAHSTTTSTAAAAASSSTFLPAAHHASHAKWLVARLGTTLTLATVISGWARVLATRARLGLPLWPERKADDPRYLPPQMPKGARLVPRGLTPASMIGEETWKKGGAGDGGGAGQGRANNKKKR